MSSIVDIFEENGVKYQDRGNGEFNICCLFCPDKGESPDLRFRLGFNVKGPGHCFNCGWTNAEHPSKDSVKAILQKLKVRSEDYTKPITKKKEKVDVRLPEGFKLLIGEGDNSKEAITARWYLRERGVTEGEMKRHHVGVTVEGYYAGRIIFPVVWKQELVAIVSRDYTGKAKIRYINSKGDKYIWGVYYNGRYRQKKLILCEGTFKALAITRATGINAGGLLGHSLTGPQRGQLDQLGVDHVILWPDPILKEDGSHDKAGIEGFVKIGKELLVDDIRVEIVWPIPVKQADEMSAKRVKIHYHDRRPFSSALENALKLHTSNTY